MALGHDLAQRGQVAPFQEAFGLEDAGALGHHVAGPAAQHRVGQPAQVAQGAQAERAAELLGGALALGAAGGVGRLDEQAGRLAVHDDEGRLLGDRDRVGLERVEVDVQRVLRGGAGDGERIEQADVRARRPLRLLLGAGQRQGIGIVAQGEQQGHREGGARREAGADRDRAGHLDRPPAPPGGGHRRRSPAARQEGVAAARGCVGPGRPGGPRRARRGTGRTPRRRGSCPGLGVNVTSVARSIAMGSERPAL